MMKNYLRLLLLFLLISCSAFTQNYGNEWINYSQKYYSFNVYRTGIYRLDQSALVAGNIPVSSFSSANIQIFGREREIPLLIVDGNDNSMDPGDYILFYAQRNDGWIDSLIYRQPGDIANPGFSLYNDTIQYFFTWNASSSNSRFTVETDVDFSSYTPANFVLRELSSAAADSYSEGYKEDLASGSIFAAGEGWGFSQNAATTNNSIQTIPLSTQNLYTGVDAPDAKLHISAVSNSAAAAAGANNHHLRMEINPGFLLIDTSYNHYKMIKFNRTIPVANLTSGYTNMHFGIIADLGATIDRQTLNYFRLIYPRIPHANGLAYDEFSTVFNTNAPKTFIDLQGLTATTPIVFSFGPTPRALTAVSAGANWQFLVPNKLDGSPNRIVIGELNNAFPVSTLSPVNGSGQFTDFSALSMEEACLMVYHSKLQTSSAGYANYRSSLPGGNHNVILANISELYQQYGGGVEKHAIAIRRFALHAYQLSTLKPVALFLMGKGITESGNGGTRFHLPIFHQSLIPSMGYPSSDVALTAGLLGTNWEPLIPTGRIAVETDVQLQAYLNKVIEYEAVQGPNSPVNSDWQKQVMHFVGGSTAAQQQNFRAYMDAMATVIEQPLFAGHTNSYYKTTSDPLDPTVISSVTDRISKGVSLMNFFGHAAASNNGFEINIDEPSNWENQGKYPVVIGNSCYNGNIFTSDFSTSEKFVILPNEGAIAFISSSFVGYDLPLNTYSNRLYRHFSELSYGQSIGLQMQRTIRDIQHPDPTHIETIFESSCTQMTLHGDPMIRLNWHTNPEIKISQEDIYFEPTDLNLTVDSIDMYIVLHNFGMSVTQPFNLEIRRNFPGSQTDSVYTFEIPFLNYIDTFHFKFPMQPNIGIGENHFDVTVDLPSFIPEEHDDFQNNQVAKTLFIRVDGIFPVYPYDFAVVPIDSVTVKASTIDPIAPVRTYLFELDTVHYYNSPQLRRYSVTEVGGVKQVNPSQWKDVNGNPFPLVCKDSVSYFWRVAVDSSVLVWTEYSFQYIPGKVGWGQDHFFQFKKNDFYNIVYDTLNRLRTFSPPQMHQVDIYAYNSETVWNSWTYDGDIKEYSCLFYGSPALYVFVIDPVTMEPWGSHYETLNPGHSFGNGNDNPDGPVASGGPLCPTCHNRSENYFAFEQGDAAQLAAFTNMIQNVIPAGHYVGIYTNTATQYSTWDALYPGIYNAFQNTIGSTLVHSGQVEEPFALFYKNGDPSTLVEKHYPDTINNSHGTAVHVTASVFQSSYSGIEKTPVIGPAYDWQAIYWKRDSLELFPSDSVRLYIEALDINKAVQLTIDTLFTPNDSILQFNNLLNASAYPYLRLGVYYSDDQFFTPAQVDRLHVLFQPVPEAAIDGTAGYYIDPATDLAKLKEGQNVSFAIDIKNISAYDMDSLLVRYWVEDVNHVKHYIPYKREDSLRSTETLRDTVRFSTLGYTGLNSFWMEVNPYINGSVAVTDQLEQFHFNNLLQLPFTVEGDDVHPILDVTFNGKHILNRDIIDPESEILITLKDDNPYLVMDNISDTTLFGIYITDPAGNQRRIPFIDGSGNTVMQWIPAEAQSKKFKIIYPAAFEQDGIYTLFVQGTDRSGNISGDIEYKVSFEIIRESSITYMMNYPNPFSTSTRFVFTLTGTEKPDDMIIQIMTVTGRVVREITETEIGPISIGRNISEYAWDGTDEFGDPLANGVYLYRVKAKINGEDIKHRESGADSHFKKEFGKMYLMR